MKGTRINKHVVFYENYFHRNFHGRNFKALSLPDLNSQIKQYGIDQEKLKDLVKLESFRGLHCEIYHDPATLFNYKILDGFLVAAYIVPGMYYLPSDKDKIIAQLNLIQCHERTLASAQSELLKITL